ncbi:hypothetical protein HYV87_04125 [Candidatus Woesearchaeota archaeon]|nr:hypothetical protein [Candidatus Woesearchaeota archaeon]
MAVLVLGLAGNPFAFSNFDNKVEPSISGFDFSSSGGLVFAQTEDDDDENETEDEAEDDTEVEDEAENEERAEDEQENEEESEETEIKVEIENGIADIEVKINGEETEFEMESTDRGEIIEEIALRTGLTVEEIEGVIIFEVKEAEEELDEEIEDDVDEESGKVTICHVPPGNPRKAHTITIDRAALERHLAHGDFVGECDDDFDKKLKEREAKLAEKEARITEKQEEREARLAEKRAEIEKRLAENDEERGTRIAEKQDQALQRAEEIIKRLEQRIVQLEQRVQTLLDMVDSGEYFGRTVGENLVTNTYSISFDGTASSLFDESITTDISGEIFLENLPTGSQISKFRVTGGEIVVGENIYDLAFGKARVSSSGPSGEKDSMVLIGEVIDFEGNQNTLRLTLDLADSLEGEFGSEPIDFEILPQSKISRQWSVSAQGQLSVV